MSRAVDVNAPGRLQSVESIEEGFQQRPAGGGGYKGDVRGPIAAESGDGDKRQLLEKLCLRAERQGGPEAWQKVLPLIHDRLREAPSDVQAWVHLGRAHMAKGKVGHDEALRAADEALRLDPKMPLGYALDAVIARRCIKAREWPTAVRHAEAALASQPGDPECLEFLARALAAQDKSERAESALSALASTAPDRSAKLAYSFASEKGSSSQQRHFWLTRAVTWARGPEKPLRELGEVCLVLHRDEEASQCFQKAFAQSPNDIEVVNALAQMHVRAGHVDEAIEVYRIASRQLPDSYPVHRKLGQLLLQERQASEAVEVIRRAARLAPAAESSSLYVALADLQQSMGLHSEALRAWEAAVALDENSAVAWRGLASASAAIKNERAQLRALTQLCRLEPNNSDWPVRLQQLNDASGTDAAKASEATPVPSVPASTAVAAAPPKASPDSAPSEDWREKLIEAQELEVYSKSASKWIPSRVVQLSADMVKLKYLIDGHWCEKVLLRNSDMLRPRQQEKESEVRKAPKSPRETPPSSSSPQKSEATPAQRPSKGVTSIPSPRSTTPPKVVSSSKVVSADPAQVPQSRSPRSWTAPTAGGTEEGGRRGWSAPSATPASAQPKAEDPPRRQWTQPVAEPVAPKPAPRPAAHPELLEPSELQFGQVLGSGGFGAVYKGMYRGEEVAIKKLHPMDGQITQLQMEEFKKEVANLQALRHERLVRFIGAAFVKPSLCLVLEFMANGSLYDLLHQRRQQLTNVQRLNMALQIAEGVGFLHGRTPPFVHRDLKSLNVVLDMALNVKLCDFGLTQSMEKTHISRKDNEGGSPRYMAPELFDSKGRITEKVDVWALGCLAVEVFTGRVPHEECNTIQQVMIKTLVNKQLPFLDWTGVHPEIRNLAELCFVFDPRARIDAARFMEGLRGLHGL